MTEKICKHGHVGNFNKWGACRRCAADAAKRARMRDPEKFRARDLARKSGPNRDKWLAAARERHHRNRERNLSRMRDYARRHRTAIANRQRQYNQKPKTKAMRWRYVGLPTPTRLMPDCCECCGRPRGNKNLHLDHDHVTGVFRGWLCFGCNTAIGKLGDSREGVQLALAYFDRLH